MSGSDKMKLVRAGSADASPAKGALYVGGQISFSKLAGGQVEVYSVEFAPGARNRVHIHRYDQILIATEGCGIIADEGGAHFMEPGDVVTIPAGHPHWHGATADDMFTHLTVAMTGDEIEIVDSDARGAWGVLPEGFEGCG